MIRKVWRVHIYSDSLCESLAEASYAAILINALIMFYVSLGKQ